LRALFQRIAWRRPLNVAGAPAVVLPWLMFWQPPILVGIGADALLVAALVWSIRSGRSVPPHEGGAVPGARSVALHNRATALSR
jgi:hypothetical protein